MRHLWSFLGGVVAAPLIWVLIALGQDGSAQTISRWVEVGTYNSANLIESTAYLAVGGIVLGLLGMLRTSPLGPFTAGLLLTAPHIGMFVTPFTVRDAIPDDWNLFDDRLALRLPLENGTLFLIGVMLLLAVFSGQRWRRWPQPAPAGAPTSDTDDHTDDRTLTDWPPVKPAPTEPDTVPMNLGHPDPPPPVPPQHREGESPWSAPPKMATRENTTK